MCVDSLDAEIILVFRTLNSFGSWNYLKDHTTILNTDAFLQMKRVFRGNGLRDCEKKSIWANGKSLGYERIDSCRFLWQ